STLLSTEAINASPRSFTPFGPDWDNGSTALITVGGEYDGSIDSGPLSFEVRRPGVRGIDDLQIRAYEPDGNRIRTYDIRDDHPLDRQYNLRNGMFFTLGSGTLIDDDTAEIQISDSVGSVFNPNLPFNGVRNNNPNFQYYDDDPLDPIVDGSFELNGETIAVNADDTLTAIVDRINQSAAGVTANYNSVTEQIEFTQQSTGSAPSIDIQNDTSNLIVATKLSGASVVPGVDPETEVALQDVAALSSIVSGSFFVNGAEFTIDKATDSLNAVIQNINAAAVDVTASFDSTGKTVKLESSSETSFVIDSNGTNLFAALNMVDGRVDGEATGISRRRAYAVADQIEDAFGALNALFTNGSFKDGADHTGVFRNVLANAVDDAFKRSRSDALFGLNFDTGKAAKQRGYFAGFDRQDFTQNLRRNGGDVKRALAGSDGSGGLVNDLGSAAVQALRNINEALGLRANYIDTFA
ncbi:MAG: hypothetical protein HKP32_12125, partial [Woeseia sp.]|nr:hypothetical protein [Woeseia sp.]